ARVIERFNPRYVLTLGFACIGGGNLWLATIPVSDTHLPAIAVPLVIVGIGFALSVAAVTAVTVNTVPIGLAGMASGTTSLLRDFGFALAPAVIGTIALSRAAAEVAREAPQVPRSLLAAAGPLGLDSPARPAGAAVQRIAFDALGHAYSLGFVICGVCGLLASLLVLCVLRGHAAAAARQVPAGDPGAVLAPEGGQVLPPAGLGEA
ncbi:MAG TPA: hypothetical protein VHF26_22175, partial [Trebonia sp.]|nr:hypothetical protein [Trebonia sp.]